MKNGKKIFWGSWFLAAAVLMIAGNFYDIPAVKVLWLFVLAAILIKGICRRNFAMILFPAAIAVILNSKLLGLEAVDNWSVLAAALLGSIGLSVLFPKKHMRDHFSSGHISGTKKYDANEKEKNMTETTIEQTGEQGWREAEEQSMEKNLEDSGEGCIRIDKSFGNTVKYISGAPISDVRLENSFGNMVVYFSNAVLKNNEADVRAETYFGNMVLYIPASWTVEIWDNTAFGSVRVKGCSNPDGRNTLRLRAEASFGSLEICYI